ncbi:MAG: hypothetical protein DMG22_17915, partial [Acidobacteria bacterium]
MIEHVGRIFSLKRDEVVPASLLFFYLFLALGAFMMGQAVGDALFLKVFPRHLPYAMIGSALLSLPFATVFIRLSHRLRLEPLIISSLGFFSVCFALFWWFAGLGSNVVYFLVYVWVQTFGVMGPMMGWTLANFLLTTREARRVFGFIQAGAILGVPFVTFITADILSNKRAKPQTLLLALSLLVAICAVLVKLLFLNARERLAHISAAPMATKGAPRTFLQSWRQIRSSRYLMLVATLIAVGCLSSSILSVQFKLIAAKKVADTSGLGTFFARFYGYMGLGTMLLQMVMTGPLLRKFGIRVSLFV